MEQSTAPGGRSPKSGRHREQEGQTAFRVGVPRSRKQMALPREDLDGVARALRLQRRRTAFS
jgi:hypothetical protein